MLCVCLVKLAINTFVFHVITVYPNVSFSLEFRQTQTKVEQRARVDHARIGTEIPSAGVVRVAVYLVKERGRR